MEVRLENLSRSFGRQQVLKNISTRIKSGECHAILGGNGSGKSTLLKLIQGSLTPTSGKIHYRLGSHEIPREKAAYKINLTGPYLELIEELTAREFLNFFQKFRPLKKGITTSHLLEHSLLHNAAQKEIRNFSSGMRQRLRLGLALFTKSDLILLDEPTSNLDPQGVIWYRELIEKERDDRTMVIGSNFDPDEMDFCSHQLKINHVET